MNRFLLIIIVITFNISMLSQPLNNSGVKVLSNTTIFPKGYVEACHASTIVEQHQVILSPRGLPVLMKGQKMSVYGYHFI